MKARSGRWAHRTGRLARGPAGPFIAFAGGIAEATFLPVLPDVSVAVLGAAAPERIALLALCGSAGSACGGVATYVAGAAFGGERILRRMPLVTQRMRTWAAEEMQETGTRVLWPQPWTGVPFRVFGYQASESGLPFVPYLLASAASRGFRVVLAGGAVACAGAALRTVDERAYPIFVVGLSAIYAESMRRLVRHWSKPDALPPPTPVQILHRYRLPVTHLRISGGVPSPRMPRNS